MNIEFDYTAPKLGSILVQAFSFLADRLHIAVRYPKNSSKCHIGK
jgi:hypothetical protein